MTGRTDGLIKTYLADGAVLPHRFVKPGTTDGSVDVATSDTDLIIGVSDLLGATGAADPCDVLHSGICDLKIAGNVTRGAKLTAGAAGAGVEAAPGAGNNTEVGAVALASGVSGDIIPALVIIGTIQG